MSGFKNGETVFDIHGREATYLALGADGYVVQTKYEHDDYDEPLYGQPEVWRDIYRTPPTVKLHGEVAEIEAKLNAARTELSLIRQQRQQEDREDAARVNERKQFAQLKTLDDFIAGKITHFFVVEGYGERMSIQTFDQFMKFDEDRCERKLRLLSLFGGSKGDLSWYVDRYSDGSGGSNGRCFPALSYEDAVRLASEWIDSRYADVRTKEQKHASLELQKSAERFGLAVPDDIAHWAAQTAASLHESNLKHARKQLDEARAKLRELESKS